MWADVTDLLLEAASRTAVVLVIDDLQWTDPASQALLQHLLVVLDHAATTRPVHLLTVVTVRTPSRRRIAPPARCRASSANRTPSR